MKLLPLNFEKANEYASTLESSIIVLRKNGRTQKVGKVEIDYFNYDTADNVDGISDADRHAAWLWYETDDYNWSFTVDALQSVNWNHELHEGLKGNMGILHKMTILPNYRNKGLGRLVFNQVKAYFKEKQLDYLILQPCAFEKKKSPKFEEYQNRLKSFYESFGLQVYVPADRLINVPYMYLNLKTA